jgi:hypothetical protein
VTPASAAGPAQVLRTVDRARRRLAARRTLAMTLQAAVALAAAGVLFTAAARLGGWTALRLAGTTLPLLALVAAVAGWLRRPSRRVAARALDAALGTDERFLTAVVWLEGEAAFASGPLDGAAAFVVDDAARCAAPLVRLPLPLWTGSGAQLALRVLATAALVLGSVALARWRPAPPPPPTTPAGHVASQLEAARLRQLRLALEREGAELRLPDELHRRLREVEKELQAGLARQDALSRIDTLEREAGRWKEALERAPDGQTGELLARRLTHPASRPLAEALRSGDPGAVERAARSLTRRLSANHQRRGLGRRLERARKRLERGERGATAAERAADRAAARAMESLQRALENGDRQAARQALKELAKHPASLQRALRSLQRDPAERSAKERADDERLQRALEKLAGGQGADAASEELPFADEASQGAPLSAKEREQLLRELEEAVKQLEKLSPEERKALEAEMRRMREGMAAGDEAASGQAAQRLARRLGWRVSRARSLMRALSGSRARLAGGSAAGGKGGSDAGTGHTFNPAAPFTVDRTPHDRDRLDPSRRPGGQAEHQDQNGTRTMQDQVKTVPAPSPSQDRGPGPLDEMVAVESIPGPEGSRAPLGRLPAGYARAAREALRGEGIPPGLRRQVARYFGDDLAAEPASEGAAPAPDDPAAGGAP